MSTVWGLLPVGAILVGVMVVGLGAVAFGRRRAGAGERLLAGALLTLTIVVVAVRGMGAVGALSAPMILGVLSLCTLSVAVAVHVRALPWWPRCSSQSRPASAATLPAIAVVVGGLAIATAAAYLLPVWQWDALGYHLPYVAFALQRGTFADIPADVPYLSTYPHAIEHAFIAWRALLPDDRLVELAHLPLGLMGALAIAVIARGQGARGDVAVLAGAVWLTLPAVFLQLPTNYVDVASVGLLLTAAAFTLGSMDRMDRTRILLAAVALGLFLGSKPTAPLGAVLMFTALAVVAWRAGYRGTIVAAGATALLLGGESYVTNVVRLGNPVWPVQIGVGPVRLPGPVSMADLLASGAAAPRTHGNVVSRVIQSWSTLAPAVPAFDMRIGGLGVLFLAALPVAVVRVIRMRPRVRAVVVLLVVAATLAQPDPAVARYVLGFAGLVLAFAVPALDSLRSPARAVMCVLAAIGAAHNLYVAYPGLTGEGPPLRAYIGMTDDERRRAVGADGSPAPFLDAVAQVGPNKLTVYDLTAELPYLAWPPDLSRRVERIPDDITPEQARALVDAPDVRLFIVGEDTVTGAQVRRDPGRFRHLFDCPSGTCAVYLRI